MYFTELNCEKRINNELIKQNDELRDHDKLLRTLVDKESKQQQNLFSNVVKNSPMKQDFSCSVVKPDNNFKGNALQLIQNKVASNTKSKVLKIDKANNGNIFIKCNSVKDSEDIAKVINNSNINLTAKTREKKKIRKSE